MSAIIIIKGLVGSSRQLFPSWQWSTLFIFFFLFSRDPVSRVFPFLFLPNCAFLFLPSFFLVFLSLSLSRYSLWNNSARCNRCFRRKSWSNEAENFFFFSRISLLLPFRCLEISLSFFFSKEFTIKYLRISMYNRVVALLIEWKFYTIYNTIFLYILSFGSLFVI